MQEFITRAAAALGVSDAIARQATGAMLDLVSKSASSVDVQQLLSKVPGAADLLKAVQPPPPAPPPSPASSVFGALGDMVSSATSALGALGASPGALLDFIAKSGLSPQQGGAFAKMFIDFVRQHAGDDLVEQIVKAIPGVKTFLG